ncbi:class I SAM-dependent methyltransferase [Candidatus Neomarinimicrobiota bacterium]
MSKSPYQKSARWYDTIIEPLNAGLRQIGLKMMPPEPGQRVLDVGCGTGTHLDLYRQAGCKVFGIDLSSAMLDVARQKLGDQAQLLLGDASRMPYPDASYDMVMVTLALHEMPPATRLAVLGEMRRVLKQTGRILIIDYHPGSIRSLKGWLFRGIIFFIEWLAGGEHFRNYRHFLSKGGVLPLGRQFNLAQVQTKFVTGGNLGLFVFAPRQTVPVS